MLTALFFGFLALGLALVVVGTYTGDKSLSLVGLSVIFVISATFITTGIEYKSGVVRNETYVYESDNTTINHIAVVESDTFTGYQNKTIAIYLAALAALGFAYVLSTLEFFNRD